MMLFRLNTLWKRLTDTSCTPSWWPHVSRDEECLSRNEHWESYTNCNDERFRNLNANCDQNTYLLRLCTITSEDIKYPESVRQWDGSDCFENLLQWEAERLPETTMTRSHVIPEAKFWKQILQRIRHHISNLDKQSTIVLFRWWSVIVSFFWVC